MYCVQAALQRRAFFWNQLDAFYRLVEQMSRWNKRCAIMLFSTARWCWQVKPVEMKWLFFSVLDSCAVTQSASSFVFEATARPTVFWRGRLDLTFMRSAEGEQIYFEFQISGGGWGFIRRKPFLFSFLRKSWSDLKVAPRLGKPFLLLSCIHVI